jgi:hypothetical protein
MSCPIIGYNVDEIAARWIAGAVIVITGLAYLFPGWPSVVLLSFLAADFATRAFSRPQWSPVGMLVRKLLQTLNIAPQMVNAGPKRFAARVGLGFALALLVCALLTWNLAFLVIAGMLLFCALLECALGFCVGCQMYTFWYAVRQRFSGA